MKALRRSWKRLAGSFAGRRREAEMAAELEFHVQMLTEENARRGLSPAEARRAALVTFGGVESAKERCRDQRGLPALDSFGQDLRYALRGMRRNPLFTAIAVACLAMGIGANTAIFSLFNAVMLRALPVSHPEGLVFFRYTNVQGDMGAIRRLTTGFDQAPFPWAAYEAFRDRAGSLAGVFGYVPTGIEDSLTVDVSGRPFTASGEMVTGNYFSLLGVAPAAGRAIGDSDLAADAPGVVVISQRFWMREFAGAASALGRTIQVNRAPFTIAGVAPAGFTGLGGIVPDLWFPLRPTAAVRPWGSRPTSAEPYFTDRRWWWCNIGGRLRPGATLAQVEAETAYLFRQSITAGVHNPPRLVPGLRASNVSPAFQTMRRKFSSPLGILAVTAALMLLMACVNVATLLVARARARQREIGVRLAVGASRARVVRQLLTESLLLSGCGGLLGLVFAYWGAPALLSLLAGRQESPLNAGPDATVLAFAAAVSLATGVLFGLAPALRAARRDLAPQLTEAAAPVTPGGGPTRLLVAAQVALSVVLLFGAGLFVRTFRNLDRQDIGFQRDNLLLFDIDPARSGYTGARAMALHNQIAERIAQLPGVRSVSYLQEALLSGWFNSTPSATDGPPLPAGQPDEDYYNRVGPGFFETLGMRIVLGRGIESRDTDGAHPAAVVNESWARSYFPGQSPLGHRVTAGGGRFDPEKSYEIVGVAADAKYNRMREAPRRTVYIAYGAKWDRVRKMCFAVRTVAAPLDLAASVREALHEAAPALPVYNVRTQREQIAEAMGQERMLAHISGFFGALAVVLVAIGIYGTLSYAVTRRTGEIGIRMALGARRSRVVWMFLRESLLVAAAGIAAGLPAALALSRLASSALFGIGSDDGTTIAATVLTVAAIASLAGFLPASRASRIDPMRALRHE